VLGAQELQVTLQYRRTSRAQVRGIDTKTDIAVIHVDYRDLPEPQMGAGKVIGTNTALIQFAQGIGFAIATEPAMWVAKQLIEGGELVRRRIAISAVDLNPKIVAHYKLSVERSVLVTAVMHNSQAAVWRIQPGIPSFGWGALDFNYVRDLMKVMNAPDVGDVVDTDLVGNQRLTSDES
jgi:S1-C subfamily serine protease